MKNAGNPAFYLLIRYYSQFYIENKYDVTSLFQMRNSQIQTYLKSTAVLLCLGIVLVYVISSWLMKPIKRLSEGLKEVTQDNVYSQLEVTGDDEIADVMIDFNGLALLYSLISTFSWEDNP